MTYVFYEPRGSQVRAAPGCEPAFYPTVSRSKLTFPADGVRLATQLHLERPLRLIVEADPMGSGLVGCWLKQRVHLPLLVKVHTQYFGHLQPRLTAMNRSCDCAYCSYTDNDRVHRIFKWIAPFCSR